MTKKKERGYSSLEALLKRSDTNPVNKKFFELLEESATKEEFTEKWNSFVDKKKDTHGCFLNLSNFKFDIDNQEIKNTFKFFATRGRWNFSGLTFFNVIFQDSNFEGGVNFQLSTFKGNANFWKSTYGGDANFRDSISEGNVEFSGSIFEGDANFQDSNFEGDVEFSGSIFKKNTDFHESTFEGQVNFYKSTFEGYANFQRLIFKKNAYFHESTFEGQVNFYKSTFKGDAYFRKSIFGGDINFESIDPEISYSNILTKLILSTDKKIKDFFQDQKEILDEINKLSNDDDKSKKIELLLNNFVKHFKKNTLQELLYDLKIEKDISNKINFSQCSFNKQFLFSLLPSDNEKICIQTILDINTTSFTEYTYFNLTNLEKLPNIYKSHISNLQNLRIDDDSKRGLKELSKNNNKNNLQFFRKFYKEKLDHHKYLNFSSAELEKKIRENKISYDNIIIWFYKIFSGYGRSIKRPVIVWLIFNFIPLIFRVICNSCKDENLISYQIFIKSIFPVYFPKSLDNIEVATMIFMWFQTPINLILLFLIGLGIKNRINIK